jgi:hypothetical protein
MTTKTETLEAVIAETLKRHDPKQGHTYNAETQEYFTVCTKCGLDIHGAYEEDEERGRIFIGWFSDGKNAKGNYVGVIHCPIVW